MWTADLLTAADERLATWREAVRLDAALNADGVLAEVRAALADDLDAPAALAAVDAWAGASLAIDGDDADAPALVARAVDALLGVRLWRRVTETRRPVPSGSACRTACPAFRCNVSVDPVKRRRLLPTS